MKSKLKANAKLVNRAKPCDWKTRDESSASPAIGKLRNDNPLGQFCET
ncbi:MAG: hypothetical protein HDR34_02435 [Treponema sp.]|nr:hypothetical protein [Treponema sp.]